MRKMNDTEAIEWLICERENYSKDSVYRYYMGLAVTRTRRRFIGIIRRKRNENWSRQFGSQRRNNDSFVFLFIVNTCNIISRIDRRKRNIFKF